MEPRVIVLIAFISITVLTALAVLAASVGWLPDANEQLVTWGLPTIVGEIVATMIMFFKGQWDNQVVVNLGFGNTDSFSLDFDAANCTYSVFDSSGTQISSGNIAPVMGHGGWQITLPVNVNQDHSISLSLVTQAGEKWAIRPFLPFVHTQNAVKQG